MRISRIDINNFAAVKGFHCEPRQITVIHGPNESMKTMILDAVLLTLFTQTGFSFVVSRYSEEDRVGARVSVSMDGGREFTIDGRDNLERMLKLPKLSARNLLVARAGELGFHEEEGWWGSVRDNLTGFEGGLGSVEHNILEDVGLTPKTKDWKKEIKQRINELVGRQGVLKDALDDAQNVNRLQVELSELERKLDECRRRIGQLRAARERDRYTNGASLVEEYNRKRSQIEEFKKYKDADYENWRDADKRLGESRVLKESLRNAIEKLKRDIDEKNRELHELAQKIGEGESRAVNVFAEIERKLGDTEVKRVEAERASEKERPVEVLAAMASAAAAIFLYFSLERGWAYVAGMAASAVAALFLWKSWVECRKRRSTHRQAGRDLLDQTRHTMPDANSVEEIRKRLEQQRRDLDEMRGKRERAEKEIKDKEEEHRDALDRLSRTEQEEREIARDIGELREVTGCSTPQELKKRLDRKRGLETEIDSLSINIKQVLEVSSQDQWQEALRKLEPYKDAEGEWDHLEYEGLQGKERKLEQSIQNVQREWQLAREVIVRVGCSTPEEVFINFDEVTRELQDNQQSREAALAAIEALNAIAGEKDKVINNALADGHESAQSYFERITGGKYSRVHREGGLVRAQMSDGREFSIEQLSTGTQAQLFFALRVSLIGRIFTEPPFLLLDDPFLSADDQRLRNIMDFLKELAGLGWQIIYFTVDGRVVSLLNGAKGCSSVHL